MPHVYLIPKKEKPSSENCYNQQFTIKHTSITLHYPEFKEDIKILTNSTTLEQAFREQNDGNIYSFLNKIYMTQKCNN